MVRTAKGDELLNDLLQHPGIKELERRLAERKAQDAETFALAVLSSPRPLEQRVVDEKRGFWMGADWFLREAQRGKRAYEREGETE